MIRRIRLPLFLLLCFSTVSPSNAQRRAPSRGQEAFFANFNKNLEAAEQSIKVYEDVVARATSDPTGLARQRDASCRANFSMEKALATPEMANNQDVVEISARYHSCVGLVTGNTSACSVVNANLMLDKTRNAQQECTARVAWRLLIQSLVRKDPSAVSRCVTVFSTPNNPPVTDHIMSARIPDFCRLLASARDPAEVVVGAQSMAIKPFTAEVKAQFYADWSSILTDGYQCPEKCSSSDDGCCEHVAIRRAALAKTYTSCGPKAPYCSAMFGGGVASCAPLYAGLINKYCKMLRSGSDEAVAQDEVSRTYREANDKIAALFQAIDGYEPKTDPQYESGVERARELRKQLDDSPKWHGSGVKSGKKR